jgi:CheY-like chemotaxis protein
MRIFVIEDEPASIESAKIQFGKDHELVFFSTAVEIAKKFLCGIVHKNQKPDFILTDVNIPMGDPGNWGVKKYYLPNDIIPAGLVVAIRAAISRIPTVIVTNSDHHRDMIGLLLDEAGLWEKGGMISVQTVPNWIKTPVGKGKDWLGSMPENSIEGTVNYLVGGKV